ncbi:MAG: F0F1 ATP synthase subunit B, partial [Clostridia bacterium]|nr:F0F1 ATP synthase subunit B [Clostridia bacterium]
MQSLDVISINLWDIVISLLNLIILFILVKKFLFKPVNNMIAKRQAEVDKVYSDAYEAKKEADADKEAWDEKMKTAKDEAQSLIDNAQSSAKHREERIVSEAREKAESIIRQAETQAELERKKAKDDIKKEIVEVSTALANKMLERE